MAQDDKVRIGTSNDFLEGVSVDTPAGDDLFREGVVISDPVEPDRRALVTAGNALLVSEANTTGTWGYAAGTSGTPTLPANAKVLQISATSLSGGSFTVNGGSSITIPANQQFTLEPRGNLVSPTVAFTGTSSYVIEYAV